MFWEILDRPIMALCGVSEGENNALDQCECSSLNEWFVLVHSKNRWTEVLFVLQKKQKGEEIF